MGWGIRFRRSYFAILLSFGIGCVLLHFASRHKRAPRLLCWVHTFPPNHQSRAIHVKETWGRKCDKVLFMSTKKDPEIDSIELNVTDGRMNLVFKQINANKYIYKHHLDDAEWFLKSDDNTFVVVENVRHLLKDYDYNHPIILGSRFKSPNQIDFMGGGAGYVMSKAALRKYIEHGVSNKCRKFVNGEEDSYMGICMKTLGVEFGDSRDSSGRYRFLQFAPENYMDKSPLPAWYREWIYYPFTNLSSHCCSDKAASYHRISGNQMHVMNYLIYGLTPFGVSNKREEDAS